MKRDVTVISLRQFESAGGLAEGYSFEDFSCPLNEEVEDFLQKKAVHSLHLGASMTYLVYDNNTSRLLGYFTLVLKPFSIEKEKLSKTKCRLIERFADVDKERYTADSNCRRDITVTSRFMHQPCYDVHGQRA